MAEDAERLETGEERSSSLQKGRSLGKQISRAVAELAGMTERLPFVGQCPMMEVGRVRTVLGCGNPDRQASAAGRSELLPRPFGVGEPVAYVQAPKAKGHRSLSIGFPTPRPRVTRAVCGGAPQTFSPFPGCEELGMNPLATNAVLNSKQRRIERREHCSCVFATTAANLLPNSWSTPLWGTTMELRYERS